MSEENNHTDWMDMIERTEAYKQMEFVLRSLMITSLSVIIVCASVSIFRSLNGG